MRKKALMVVAGIGLLICLFGVYRYYAAVQFAESYRAYAERAAAHSNAAFFPGARGNPLREELNGTLARILSDTSLKSAERLALAEHGLALLKESERQIDEIGTTGERMEEVIIAMEADASGLARADIVALARERFRIIADIRGLSYRANFQTAEIFNRIIKDGGKLTDAHIRELNNQIPLVEEQFDKRTNLYVDLESANSRMENAYAELSVF